jgi:hypothetical protein
MTDAHATPGPVPPPPPRRHGCLYGCLIAVGIFVLAAVAGGYWFYSTLTGAKDEPTVKAAMVQLNGDQQARAILGDNVVVVLGMGFNKSIDAATGTKESYVVHVKGTKGEGDYTIEADTPKGGALHFDKLSVQVSGQTIDILHAEENPGGAI